MKKFILQPAFIILLVAVFCLADQNRSFAQVQTGRSYINVTKNATGGTFEPGDTLEIRSSIAVGNWSSFSISRVRYNDTIGTNFTYIPGTLKILTNEGLVFRSFTDAANDDAAMFDNTNKTLRINLGTSGGNATNTGNGTTGGGTIAYNNKPSFWGGVCIMVASFRVKINNFVPYNALLTMPGGAFRFIQSSSNIVAGFSPNNLMVFQNLGVCPNFVGGNAVIENNGSFGSGNTQNRNASAIVPGYTFINFGSAQPNDGYYGIANNTSATGATNNGVGFPHSTRVHSVWDIIGDHTGAASPTLGNPPTPVGTNGGYMAVVNASYAISPAIQQTVTNLCPATYYDFSAWFRNICSKCSCDSNGNGALTAGYNGPYPPGVKPNLTFQINGFDYYTTGDLPYTGLWTKKGFTYLTGSSETSFTLSIRNNSPGGGGNDWAIDDVSLATCEPNLDLKYSPVFTACWGSLVDLSAAVRCYFPNYIYYKWQKSTNGGVTWIDTGVSGTGSPTLVGGQWEYTTNYPPFIAWGADSGHRYKVVVATTAANLASTSCSYSNNTSTFLNMIYCGVILNANLTEFKGQLVQDYAKLKWTVTNGQNLTHFDVEKSLNGKDFTKIAEVSSGSIGGTAQYNYTDPDKINGITYYRLKLADDNGKFVYSSVITISNKKIDFVIRSVSNPVSDHILVDYMIPDESKVTFKLYDLVGNLIKQKQITGTKGLNKTKIDLDMNVSKGFYILTVTNNNITLNKRLVKVN